MNALEGRLVLVSASRLDDMLELARLASDRLPAEDPIALALKGAAAQVRSEVVFEP